MPEIGLYVPALHCSWLSSPLVDLRASVVALHPTDFQSRPLLLALGFRSAASSSPPRLDLIPVVDWA